MPYSFFVVNTGGLTCDFMGHKSIEQTRAYIRISGARKRAAMMALPSLAGHHEPRPAGASTRTGGAWHMSLLDEEEQIAVDALLRAVVVDTGRTLTTAYPAPGRVTR